MQPGCFTCGHFHFLFLCLLLLAITNCSGMFAFLLFNRRKFLLKTVKTFSWSDDWKASSCKIWERPCDGPCWVFIFLSHHIQLLGRRSKGKDLRLLQLSLLRAPVHLLDQHCSSSQIMPTLKLLLELEDEKSLIKTVFILRCSPCYRGGFGLLLWWGFQFIGVFSSWQSCFFSGFCWNFIFVNYTCVSRGNRL